MKVLMIPVMYSLLCSVPALVPLQIRKEKKGYFFVFFFLKQFDCRFVFSIAFVLWILSNVQFISFKTFGIEKIKLSRLLTS